MKITCVKAGHGPAAVVGALAEIRYDCYLPRGEKCGSSDDKPHRIKIKVGDRKYFPAFAYALTGMLVGEIRSVKVSPNLTYYEREVNPQIPENASLRYEIELLSLNSDDLGS